MSMGMLAVAPQQALAVIPVTGEPGKVPACLMAGLPSEEWAASESGGENFSPVRGDPFLLAPQAGCRIGLRYNFSVGS